MDLKEQQLRASFSQLIKQEKSTIYSVCMLFADEHTDADDLAQECMINLWEGFAHFQGKSSARTWLYRVCMNTCISYDRKRKRFADQVVEFDNQFMQTTSEGAIMARQYQMLHDRIKQLGPFDRALLLLWLEDLPYDEIGDIIGLSATNVGVRLARIREQLKQMNNNK